MRGTVAERVEAFRAARYFPELDGVRAVSVLLVLSFHTGDRLWRHLHGALGVTVFFVLSGFLITTLLLREEARDGHVSLLGFYVRRAFRILPLYYLSLALYAVLVAAGYGDGTAHFWHRSLYYVTYLNELQVVGTFGHSWSLGVEEKFYLFWPLMAFVLPVIVRHRFGLAAGLTTALCSVGLVWPHAYLTFYAPIVVGCLLGVVMDDPRRCRWILPLVHPLASVALLGLGAVVLLDGNRGLVDVRFALVIGALLPTVLVGRPGARGWLASRPLTYVGRRSYGMYLLHPLVLSVIDLVLDGGRAATGVQVARLVLLIAGSILVADIAYRLVERPLIDVGHRLSGRIKETRSVPRARPG